MSRMFCNAISFNQPLNSWDTSKVIAMSRMFDNATSFNQDITCWNIMPKTKTKLMFISTPLYHNLHNIHPFSEQAKHQLAYQRRKNFLLFLVQNGNIPYNNKYLQDTSNDKVSIVFDIKDLSIVIASYL